MTKKTKTKKQLCLRWKLTEDGLSGKWKKKKKKDPSNPVD